MVFKAFKDGIKVFNNLKGTTAPLNAFGRALSSVWDDLNGGAKWAIATGGIAAAITVATNLYEAYEKSIQMAQENAKAYRESADSASNYKNEVYTLITSIDSGTLSSEELYNAKSRLLEIEDGLVAAFGSEAAGLDLLSASADNAKASIEGYVVWILSVS